MITCNEDAPMLHASQPYNNNNYDYLYHFEMNNQE